MDVVFGSTGRLQGMWGIVTEFTGSVGYGHRISPYREHELRSLVGLQGTLCFDFR